MYTQRRQAATEIAEWVQAHYNPITVDDATIYDLTQRCDEHHSRRIASPHPDHKPRENDEVMTTLVQTPEQRFRFASRPNAALAAREAGVPVLDVVVPVYNEQAALADSVRRLHRYLEENFAVPVRITIADNASIDDTPRIAAELAAELDGVRGGATGGEGPRTGTARGLVHLGRAGAGLHGRRPVHRPGRARTVGGAADLGSFRSGHRHPVRPRLTGGPRCQARIHLALLQPDPEVDSAARFSDAQCGFKAIRADVARRLLPHVTDTGWFFDTELLVLAERSGLHMAEVAGGLGGRPDSRGRHRRHRHRRSQGHRPVAAVASPTASIPGEHHRRATRIVAEIGCPPVPAAPGGVGWALWASSPPGLPAAVHSALQVKVGARAANLIALPGDRDRKHRRQAAVRRFGIAGAGNVTSPSSSRG